MGLLQNGFRDTAGVFRTYGGTASNNAYPQGTLGNYNLTGAKRNLTAGEGITDDKVGLPMGYVMKGWQMPQKPGFISARSNTVNITPTGTMLRGLPGEGSATISIDTNTPAGELISSGEGSATFNISAADLLLTASINGEGSAEFSLTSNTPVLGAEASLVGSSSMTISVANATIYPLNDDSPLREGTASFTLSGSLTPYAVGSMSGSTVDGGTLTSDAIAAAVWDTLVAEHQGDGSTGKALGTASSGGVDLDLMSAAVWAYVNRTVDVTKVAGTTVAGSGTSLDPWGPV